MAQIQPIVGHLLSQYDATALEGLDKLMLIARTDSSFVHSFCAEPQALSALLQARQRTALADKVNKCVVVLLNHGGASARSSIARTILARQQFAQLRKLLSVLSDDTVPSTITTLTLLADVALYAPKLVMARFGGSIPLQLACFRQQLPFAQRRVRDARLHFLCNIATTKYTAVTDRVVTAHGFLTQVLEDAAELLLGGTSEGVALAKRVLELCTTQFASSRRISADVKRQLLLAQRNVFRLLVKALSIEAVAAGTRKLIQEIIAEVIEPTADYALSRTEADDRGMPNFVAFLILRQLNPRNNSHEAALVAMILNQCPDLIRPYFTRVSAHLSETTNLRGASPKVAAVAVFNSLTRAMLAPIPYHLAGHVAVLESPDFPRHTFFSLSPQSAADEVCPQWMGEFVHRWINSNTNLMFLAFAIQTTHAALQRAETIRKLLQSIHRQQEEAAALAGGESDGSLTELRIDFEVFDSQFTAALLKALPKREEFWHRLTQQLHPLLTTAVEESIREKAHFVFQRLLTLMHLFTSYHNGVSWLSAAPVVVPKLENNLRSVTALLRSNVDALTNWEPKSVSALCRLLCDNLLRGVPLHRIFHIQLGPGQGAQPTLAEWPLLLSLLLWFQRHVERSERDVLEGCASVLQLALLAVHSVSLRYSANASEVFYWLTTLPTEQLPMFLHTLGFMHQRSTSKIADRVAAATEHVEHGVLVEAALLMTSKAKEKKEAQAAAAVPGKPSVQQPVRNVFQLDFDANVTAFDHTVRQLAARWAQHGTHWKSFVAKFHAAAVPTAAPFELQSTSRNELLDDSEKKVRTLSMLDVLRLLVAPTTAQTGQNETASTLFDALPSTTADDGELALTVRQFSNVPSLVASLCGLPKSSGKKTTTTKKAADVAPAAAPSFPPEWFHSPLVTMAVLQQLAVLTKTDEDVIALKALLEFSKNHLSGGAGSGGDSSIAKNEVVYGCALLLILWVIRRLLALSSSTPADDDELVGLCESLGPVLLQRYTGSLTVVDRLTYSLLTHLSNVSKAPTTTTTESLSEGPSGRSRKRDAEEHESKVHTRLHWKSMPFLASIQKARYLTADVATAAHMTVEVDVLAQLVDTWTEADCQDLNWPLGMSSAVTIVRSSGEGEGEVENNKGFASLWSAAFPECPSEWDSRLSNPIVEASRPDPRYLLPLLHTVGAIAHAKPALVPPHVLTKCFSFALRSLSSHDVVLRQLASNVLVFTKSLTPLRRSLLNYARLRLLHISASVQQDDDDNGTEEMQKSKHFPMLPAAVSSFLIHVQNPLHRYDMHLHRHANEFLQDVPASFETPVPFVELMSFFPLGCITSEIMAKKHEEIQREHQHAHGASILSQSTKQLNDSLLTTAPSHLRHIFDQVRNSAESPSDLVVLHESNVLRNLMTLVSMVSSTETLRLYVLDTLRMICGKSVAHLRCAIESVRILTWLPMFLVQLCHEFALDSHAFAKPLFLGALDLLSKLWRVDSHSSGGRRPWEQCQKNTTLATIVTLLRAAGVSSKAVWDAVDSCKESLEFRDE